MATKKKNGWKTAGKIALAAGAAFVVGVGHGFNFGLKEATAEAALSHRGNSLLKPAKKSRKAA